MQVNGRIKLSLLYITIIIYIYTVIIIKWLFVIYITIQFIFKEKMSEMARMYYCFVSESKWQQQRRQQ